MQTFTKAMISTSTNGGGTLITGSTSLTSTVIHTTPAGISSMDEVWLYAYNQITSGVVMTLEWGTTGDMIINSIPPKVGRFLLTDGRLMNNGWSVKAYSSSTSGIYIDGFVNRISG